MGANERNGGRLGVPLESDHDGREGAEAAQLRERFVHSPAALHLLRGVRFHRRPGETAPRILRVVTLTDGETILNAFFDRRFRKDQP